MVERQRRDVGNLVRRLHLDPGCRVTAAAPQGDRPDVRDRRSLHRRRPLRRRLSDRLRADPVRGRDGRQQCFAAATGVPRRGVDRGVARAARGGDPHVRWLDGFVRRSGLPDAREVHGTTPGDRRQLDPRVPRRRLSRPEPRLAPRDGQVLRPLAQGRRQRRDGRADADVVPAGVVSAGAVPAVVAGLEGRA